MMYVTFAVVCTALTLTGYRLGQKHKVSEPPLDVSNESTPIYDSMIADFPATYLKLIAPMTMNIKEYNND